MVRLSQGETLERVAGRTQTGQDEPIDPVRPVCRNQDRNGGPPGMTIELEAIQTQSVGEVDHQPRQ